MRYLNEKKLGELVDARVQADIDSGRVGGAALCVVQDGKVLLNKTYGYQNATDKEPLRADAMYRLASMTKPITAVAALIAEEQGLLSIDDELCKYIPAYAEMKIGHMENGQPVYDKDAQTRITVKHLLSHTSGLGTLEIGDHAWATMPTELAKTPAGVMEWLSDKMLAFEPYTAQWYSPVAAFVAVARIIEITSGMAYNEYLDKYLFAPLGMKDITFDLNDDQKARMIAMHNFTEQQGGFAARREAFKQQEAPQEKPKIDTAYVEKAAQQLATIRSEFIRETVNSHERTSYQPNPIYARQANEIESLAKTVTEQSRTIEAFKAERDKLGVFKGKEKKEIQGKIDNFEKLRRSNLDKLEALGVSDPSKAGEVIKEKRTLAAQEQEKAKAARQNEGAGSRAEEAKQVFLEVVKQIPADQRQAVLDRMEHYNSHEVGGMEIVKAEIEARRVLDSALKEQTQSREHEKTKVKDRGRAD